MTFQALEPAYENLLARLRAGPYVHSEETSWWVGGPGHWLWVFASKDSTVYRVAEGRRRNIVVANLGAQYAGVLVSDCLSIYDGVNGVQHKCTAIISKPSPKPWKLVPVCIWKNCEPCSKRPWR